MTTTTLDLDAIRQREQAATKGPWKTGNRFGNRSLGSSVVVLAGNLPPVELDSHRNGRNDAAFIAHARQDIPALLAEVDRLREQLFAQKPVIEATQAWAELRDEEGITLADTRKADAALFDAIEQYQLMDLALTSARDGR